MDYPVYADLKKYVFDPGKGAGAGDQDGTVLYTRGMYAAMLAVEAIEDGAGTGPGTPRSPPPRCATGWRRWISPRRR